MEALAMLSACRPGYLTIGVALWDQTSGLPVSVFDEYLLSRHILYTGRDPVIMVLEGFTI